MFNFKRVRRDWILDNGMRVFDSYTDMDQERLRRMEELAFENGQYSESYLVTEPTRSYLWSAEDDGVVGFKRQGRHISIVGGLITPAANKLRFLQEISQFVANNKLNVTFYHIDDRDIPLFEALNFQITKFGITASIPLEGHNWNGKAYEWVRRQYNFVSRNGVVVQEWSADRTSTAEWNRQIAELCDVSTEHIGAKHFRGEIPFFEGRLIKEHLHRRRCFVARADNGRGRVEGFLLCTPIENGRQWAFEMYRHRNDAVRGVIPFLMREAIDLLKAEGCDGVSLCPVPAVDCEQPRPGDAFFARQALVWWNRLGSALFDTKGLYHYKSRFRPVFKDIFVCVSPKASLGSVWSYLRLTRAFDLKLGAFLKDFIHQMNPQRRTLAKPVKTPQPAIIVGVSATPVVSAAETKAA